MTHKMTLGQFDCPAEDSDSLYIACNKHTHARVPHGHIHLVRIPSNAFTKLPVQAKLKDAQNFTTKVTTRVIH